MRTSQLLTNNSQYLSDCTLYKLIRLCLERMFKGNIGMPVSLSDITHIFRSEDKWRRESEVKHLTHTVLLKRNFAIAGGPPRCFRKAAGAGKMGLRRKKTTYFTNKFCAFS